MDSELEVDNDVQFISDDSTARNTRASTCIDSENGKVKTDNGFPVSYSYYYYFNTDVTVTLYRR